MATRKPAKALKESKGRSTIYLAADSKRRLAYMKADLRAAGIAASESKIVDALISHSDADQLAKWLK